MANQVTIDAKDKPLGRLASEAAFALQGKNDPSYDPSKPGNTEVVIENIKEVKLTGKKEKQKVYQHHTMKGGGFKEKSFEQAFEEDPEGVIRHAISGMLPKNRLRDKRLKNLTLHLEEASDNNSKEESSEE